MQNLRVFDDRGGETVNVYGASRSELKRGDEGGAKDLPSGTFRSARKGKRVLTCHGDKCTYALTRANPFDSYSEIGGRIISNTSPAMGGAVRNSRLPSMRAPRPEPFEGWLPRRSGGDRLSRVSRVAPSCGARKHVRQNPVELLTDRIVQVWCRGVFRMRVTVYNQHEAPLASRGWSEFLSTGWWGN
jgi:hypothetical protein